MSTPPSTEDHVAEHIPWEHLTIAPAPDRSRLLYGVAATILLGVVAMVTFQAFARRVPAAQTAPVAAAIPTAAVATSTATTLGALATPDVPSAVSEADLMAVGSSQVPLTIEARAEWVVLEFFTLDPADDWAGRVSAASSLAIPPDLRPQPPDSSTISYVEWVKIHEVDLIAPDTFAATVIMRRLVAVDGVSYDRLPAEFVSLGLGIDQNGAPFVTTLPTIVDRPLNPLVEMEDLTGERQDSVGIGWPG